MEIEKRPIESYTRDDIKNINLLSFTKNASIFGSASYKIQKYPGDLDLFEIFIEQGIDKTVSDFKTILVNKVKRIIKLKCHWITEVKAGIDKRFDLSIGELRDGIYTPNYQNLLEMYKIILSFSYKEDYEELFYLYNFLSSIRYSRFQENIDNKTQEDYSKISEIIRNRKILRWKPKDIINERIVQNGELIFLCDALRDNSHVKIDMITYLDDRFTEVTNFFFLAAYCDNKLCLINTSYDFTDPKKGIQIYKEQISQEIESLFYNSDNFFKGVKRMWAYSRSLFLYSSSPLSFVNTFTDSKNDKEMKDKEQYEKTIMDLSPIISGNISMIYQIKSEIEAILLILSFPSQFSFPLSFPLPLPLRHSLSFYHMNMAKNDEKYSKDLENHKNNEECIEEKIKKQIEKWRVSFSHVTEWDNTFLLEIYSLLDPLYDYFCDSLESQREEYIKKFELLKEVLKKKINQMTMKELINIGYYPIPKLFLPYPRRYV